MTQVKKLLMVTGVFALGCSIALADSITFTASNATLNGGVDAQAVVTTGAGTVTVVLTNLIANQANVGQSLTDFSFTLSHGTAGSVAISSSSVNALKVGSGGAVTNIGSTSSDWGVSGSGTAVTLSWFSRDKSNPVFGGRAGGTLLGPEINGRYPDANGSIADNSAHNPFANGDMDFTLDLPGVTSSTTASDAVFSFGTTAGTDVPGSPVTPAGEPGALILLAVSLLGFAFVSRRRLFGQTL